MNERILEFAQRAGLISHFNAAPHRPDIERFAESLIRECAFEAFKFWLAQSDCNEESAQSHIKQHFGVK
jgi:hypothetical protein